MPAEAIDRRSREIEEYAKAKGYPPLSVFIETDITLKPELDRLIEENKQTGRAGNYLIVRSATEFAQNEAFQHAVYERLAWNARLTVITMDEDDEA
jgi:hypothetical protein